MSQIGGAGRAWIAVVVGVIASATPLASRAAVFVASGASPAAIQAKVDEFRAALGALNGVGGSFASGRREINWDGVPSGFSAPNLLPATSSTSTRRVVSFSPQTETASRPAPASRRAWPSASAT